MLGLDHQVDGGQVGRRLGAGDDHDLGGTGEGRGHPDGPRHLALGLGHVAVARAHDDVDRADRLGAVGHGGDRLGSAHAVDLVDPGHRRRGQGRVVDAAVGRRRHAQDHLGHAGHPGRSGTHEDRRRVAGPPARRVAPGPLHRPGQVAHGHPGRDDVPRRGSLAGVVVRDPPVGQLQGGHQFLRYPAEGGRHLVGRDPQGGRGDTVELLGQRGQGGVALPTDAGQDRRHRLADVGPGVGRSPAASPRRGRTGRGGRGRSRAWTPDATWGDAGLRPDGAPTGRPSGDPVRTPADDGPSSCRDPARRTVLARLLARRADPSGHRLGRRRPRDQEEELAGELFGVERALHGALRRLGRLADGRALKDPVAQTA